MQNPKSYPQSSDAEVSIAIRKTIQLDGSAFGFDIPLMREYVAEKSNDN
jgi:hypothetical protein